MLNDAQHNIMWVRETESESESERECVREKERKNEWMKERKKCQFNVGEGWAH